MAARPTTSTPLPSPGELLRTQELHSWSSNPNRLALKWVVEKLLRPFGPGIWQYLGPAGSLTPAPSLAQWVRVFLKTDEFIVTGPDQWNLLGLKTTFGSSERDYPRINVYNQRRRGLFLFGEQKVMFHRRRFPTTPSREWFLVDLMEHGRECGCDWDRGLDDDVWWALKRDRFSVDKLIEVAREFGTLRTRRRFDDLIGSLDGPARFIGGATIRIAVPM